jgi:SAM-dependent methyltransferase
MTDSARLFDRRAVRKNRDRAAKLWDADRNGEFLFEEVADRLLERLGDVRREFPVAVDLSARRGQLTRRLLAQTGLAHAYQFDLSENFARDARQANRFVPAAVADNECLPLADESVDLVISCLGLHSANDLPGALMQICRALRPDGLFLAAILGGNTLTELRQAITEAEVEVEGGLGPRIAPFTDVRDAGALLQRGGFALPVVDRDTITVTYEHAFALMYDLRRMGEANALTGRRRTFSRRQTFLRTAENYLHSFADKAGRLHATFDIVYLTGWAPAPGQPRPLLPGSANSRLADALDATERDPQES